MSRRDSTGEALRRLRQEAAVTDERLAAPWHASSAKQVLLEVIGDELGEAGVTAVRRHRGRRRGALLLAAALTLAVLAGTAVAGGIFRPDPRDAAEVVNQGRATEGPMHAPGWRTELNAERVQCFYDGGDRAETTASAGPLDADLRVEDLVAACAQGGRVDSRGAKLCALPAGPLRRNPKPVVLGFAGACERYGLSDAERFIEVDAERLLADINLRRQVEVAILAVDPKLDGRCHPKSEIMRLVRQRIATTGLPLEIRTHRHRLALLVRRGCALGRQRGHGRRGHRRQARQAGRGPARQRLVKEPRAPRVASPAAAMLALVVLDRGQPGHPGEVDDPKSRKAKDTPTRARRSREGARTSPRSLPARGRHAVPAPCLGGLARQLGLPGTGTR